MEGNPRVPVPALRHAAGVVNGDNSGVVALDDCETLRLRVFLAEESYVSVRRIRPSKEVPSTEKTD